MTAAQNLSFGFLLGSGVSRPLAPSTQELTDTVRNCIGDYYIHTDERWFKRTASEGPLPTQKDRQRRVQQLIPALVSLVDRYYESRRDPIGCPMRLCNYEDIAYHATALADALTRERDDPGLLPLAESLCGELGWTQDTLRDAAADSAGFIRAIVFMQLTGSTPTPDHLKLVIDATTDPDVNQLPIYTLNHDCLIEQQFAHKHLSLFDFRFRDQSGRMLLDVSLPIPESARAVLYKVHGSVEWGRFRPISSEAASDPWFNEWIGWARDQEGKFHDDGNSWRSVETPLLLVGRFNKELDYLSRPFSDLYIAVTQSLDKKQQLVVSGYGFGDKAINSLLIDWIYARPKGERRLVVLHEDRESLLASARGAVRQKWARWSEDGVLCWVPHFLQDVSWTDLKALLVSKTGDPDHGTESSLRSREGETIRR